MRRRQAAQRTASSSRPPTDDPTTAWAQDVVAGRIISGEIVQHAAERHLRDIVDGEKRGLFWRPEMADMPLAFFPAVLSVTAGTAAGQPFHLLPWHVFVVGSLFGWRMASGRMRFRSAWLETGKGQAKSPLIRAARAAPISPAPSARTDDPMSSTAVPYTEPLSPQVNAIAGETQIVEVVVPISTGTVEEALREIRDDVPAERNTLAKISDSLDQLAADQSAEIRRRSRIAAIIYG